MNMDINQQTTITFGADTFCRFAHQHSSWLSLRVLSQALALPCVCSLPFPGEEGERLL